MIRIAALIGLVLLALFAAAIGALGALDGERYAGIAAARLAAATNLSVNVEGPVELRLLPRPHLEIGQIRFASVATATGTTVELALGSLLRGHVDFANVRIEQLDLDMGPALRDLPAPAFDNVPNVSIGHARLRWSDGQGIVHELELATFALTHDLRARRVDIEGVAMVAGAGIETKGSISAADEGRFAVQISGNWTGGAQMTLSGSVLRDSESTRLVGRFEAQGANGSALTPALPPGPFRVDGQLEMGGDRAILNDVHFGFGDLGGTGAASYVDGATPRLDLALQFNRLDLEALVARAPTLPPLSVPENLNADIDVGVAAAAWRGGVVQQIRLELDVAPEVLTIQRASGLLPGGSDVSVAGRVTAEDGQPRFVGHVDAGADNLRGLLEWLGVDVAEVPGDRLRRSEISAVLTVANSIAELTEMELRLDATRASGIAAVAFRTRPSFSLDLAVDHLNLDGYRLPDTGSWTLAWLTTFDTRAKLAIDTMTIGGFVARDVALDLDLLGGKFDLRRLHVGDLGALQLDAGGSAQIAPSGAAIYEGELHFGGSSLARTASALGIDLPVNAPAGDFDFRGKVIGDPRRIDLPSLRAQIGDGTLTGNVSYRFESTSVSATPVRREVEGQLKAEGNALSWFERAIETWRALSTELDGVKVDIDVTDAEGNAAAAIQSNDGGLVVKRP